MLGLPTGLFRFLWSAVPYSIMEVPIGLKVVPFRGSYSEFL